MRLRDLEAKFLKIKSIAPPAPHTVFELIDSLADAQGIQFLCPKCFAANGGNVGTHGVICWFNGRGVPDDLDPKPGRWNPSGTGYDDLTFVGPGAVSVLMTNPKGCGWHGFVKDGNAE
jgi:hypothetical protein